MGIICSIEAELRSYLTEFYLPNATSSELDQLLTLYPQDPAQGSPFDTGDLNALSPQYKRLAALQGDLVFQVPRRFFLSERPGKQNTWSFRKCRFTSNPFRLHRADKLLVNKRLKFIPEVGSVS